MKTSIMDRVNKIADVLADILFDPDPFIEQAEAEHREQFAGSLRADLSASQEVIYCREYAPVFRAQESSLLANRQPEQGRIHLVCEPFDPDSKSHQRSLVSVTKRNYQGGTEAIQTGMTKVGIELTGSQAFSALCEHVSILQAKGVEL